MFVKYIPIPLYKQFRYKIMPEIIMKTVTALIVFVIIEAICPISPLVLLVSMILHVLISSLQTYLNFFVDLKKPKLEWDTEYAVVKQNMNLMWPMCFGLTGIAIIVAIGVLVNLLNLPYIVAMLPIGLLFGAGLIFIDKYVQKNENKLFEKIY